MTRRAPAWAWPRGLAGRTVLLLLVSLSLFHVGSLWVNHYGLLGISEGVGETRVAERLAAAARAVAALPEADRDPTAHALSASWLDLHWSRLPALAAEAPSPAGGLAALRARLPALAPELAAARFAVDGAGDGAGHPAMASVPLPDGTWLNATFTPPRWLGGEAAGDGMLGSTTTMAAGIVLVAVLFARWLTGPLRRLAEAADRMGHGHAVAMPEDGPEEVRRLARALDAMQDRIGRLLRDRTEALAAVSHDLRTPITRLRLRAGFLDDPETGALVDADLDEMEAMIAATLDYLGGGEGEPEAVADLGAMLTTLCHAAADADQDVTYDGPARLPLRCRPTALRRAVANLVGNAVKYGGRACVRLSAAQNEVEITVEDNGPGVPEEDLERVFEPFQRLESSRNRATGGVGLGLTIARRAAQDCGGTLTIANRTGGGLRAMLSLPQQGPTASPAFATRPVDTSS